MARSSSGQSGVVCRAQEMRAFEAAETPVRRETRFHVGVICDFHEEDWPSMELVADMLMSFLQRDHSEAVAATRIQPPMRMRFAKLSPDENGHTANGRFHANGSRFNADRVLNRFWVYPRYLQSRKSDFDLFHVIDHSYAQVVHTLPPERTIVTCHDLDTFQCLLNPAKEPRSLPFKQMVRRTLTGFRKAARVMCDSEATRDELVKYGLIDPGRTVIIPNGVDAIFSPHPDVSADAEANTLLGSSESIDILHVGSTIARKRIDILLRLFAQLRHQFPNARLLRVGGKFTIEQSRLMNDLRIGESVVQ